MNNLETMDDWNRAVGYLDRNLPIISPRFHLFCDEGSIIMNAPHLTYAFQGESISYNQMRRLMELG